jgi:hypothetical protein
MSIISLTDCCRLLAVDPKTLRHWMSLSRLETQQNPLDARCKYLTPEQLQQLATAHHRTLETKSEHSQLPEISALPTPPPLVGASAVPDVQSNLRGTPLSLILSILGLLLKRLTGQRVIAKSVIAPDFPAAFISLTEQLTSLQAHVASLQHQLTLLNAQLQKEQQWQASVASARENQSQEASLDLSLEKSQEAPVDSSREKAVEKSQEASLDLSLEKSQETPVDSFREKAVEKSQEASLDLSLEKSQESPADSSREKAVEPLKKKKQVCTTANTPSIDERRHSHVLPWVEYGAQGKYVVISPERGLLEFEPDSPEWFAWLSTQLSFRFAGQSGRFTAHRGACLPTRGWRASRHIRNRSYNYPIGKTESLTIATLEQVAATLQSHLN